MANNAPLNQQLHVKTATSKKHTLIKDVRRDIYLYIMVIPTVIWFIIFKYIPMGGIAIAFQKYRLSMGMFGAGQWIGLENFKTLFADSYFWRSFWNTLIISFYRIIVCLPGAIMLAIMLNEVKTKKFKTVVQTIVYIPRFLSWVIVATFAITLLNPEEGINYLFAQLGLPHLSLVDPGQFRGIVVFTDLWKDVGFNSVIFIAAIIGISPSLYESADLDGATRIQKIIYITLPSIRNTILVVLILWIGNIVSIGFDQVFNMYNPIVYETGDIIDTYIYRIAFTGGSNNFAVAAAAGFFKSIISVILLLSAELFAKSIGESTIF